MAKTFKNNLPKLSRRLEDETGIVSFSLRINPQTEKVTLTFADTNQKEEFYNIEMYLYALSFYYRRRLEVVETTEEKIGLCNSFLNTIYMYMTDWKGLVLDYDKFNKAIHVYIEQFEYFKKQYTEAKSLVTIDTPNDAFTTDMKIVILNYLGILDVIRNKIEVTEQSATLLAKLLDRNFDNVKKSFRNVNGKPKHTDAVKSSTTLKKVIQFAQINNLVEIESMAKEDLAKIDKK